VLPIFLPLPFGRFGGIRREETASESDQKDVPIISHWLTLQRGSNGLLLKFLQTAALVAAFFFLQFQMLDEYLR